MHMKRLRWKIITATLLCAGALTAADDAKPADPETDRIATAVEALSRLQDVNLDEKPAIKAAVLRVLDKTRGTANFVKLVGQFKLTDQNAGLLEVAQKDPAGEAGVAAIRLILANKDFPLLKTALTGTNVTAAARTAEALGHAGDKQSVPLLEPLITDTARDTTLRKQSVRALAQTQEGATALLALARADKLPENLKFTASSELNAARWPAIKAEAAKLLPAPVSQSADALPPVAELLKMKGDAANGAKIFARETTACSKCHQVRGAGVDFGPALYEIGTKLGKDAIIEAILDPSAGISFGFEAWQIELKSGDEAFGLIASETAEELAIKAQGGIITRYKKSDIARREQQKLSIMPVGLQQTMTTQEFVDLVEYLSSLKKQ